MIIWTRKSNSILSTENTHTHTHTHTPSTGHREGQRATIQLERNLIIWPFNCAIFITLIMCTVHGTINIIIIVGNFQGRKLASQISRFECYRYPRKLSLLNFERTTPTNTIGLAFHESFLRNLTKVFPAKCSVTVLLIHESFPHNAVFYCIHMHSV